MSIEDDNMKKVWENVKKLREEGKLPPPPTPEELADEPTALANSGYRERAEREAMMKKYPPLVPEKSTYTPKGVFGRRKEEEERKKEEMIKNAMKVEISLDPNVEWIVKTIDGKSYLSVKQN
jgi:hypothetical protein